jgi:hypothetical protein
MAPAASNDQGSLSNFFTESIIGARWSVCAMLGPPMGHNKLVGVLLLPLLLLGACSSDGFKMVARSHSVSYRLDPDPKALLLSVPPSCAVVPADAPSAPGYATLTSQALRTAMMADNRSETVMDAGMVASRISTAGLAEDWRSLAVSYRDCGVMDRDKLAKIGKALGVRHIMIPTLAGCSINFGVRFDLLGLTLGRTFWTTVDVSLQLWDALSGELVWQSTGSCTAAAEVLVATRVSMKTAIESSFELMIDDLLLGRSESVMNADVPDGMGGGDRVK